MSVQLEYSSAIKEWPLMFSETRKTALLICDGKNSADILELSKINNIYQLNKEIRRTKLPQKILVRLGSLQAEQIKLLATGSEPVAKLLCFLAVLKTDRLLFEFMREVYMEKMTLGNDDISDKDFIIYFENKINESPKIAKWTSNNIERIKNAYKRMLVDSGLAKKQGRELVLTTPICDEDERLIICMQAQVFADTMLPN